MKKNEAIKLVEDTFKNSFSENTFNLFIANLFKSYTSNGKVTENPYVREAYRNTVLRYKIVGTYTDTQKNSIDILLVKLQKETTLEKARTAQRNFIADYLKNTTQGKRSAALVAFTSPNEADWRFSFVKLEYSLDFENGRLVSSEKLTTAKRSSFLVGMNEGAHTVSSRFAPLLESDTNPLISEIETAFSIEKVTNEFFQRYCDLFYRMNETLISLLKKDNKLRNEFEIKELSTSDFTKKTMGQMAFLYFLQKKGWFGVAPSKSWGTGRKNFLRELFVKRKSYGKNFFNDILEPLFYEALALDRGQDSIYSRLNNCRMPFLNGGLFEPMNGYSWETTDVFLPDELFSNENKTPEGDIGDGILDIFDRYNFTVNENDPLEKDVAVDPEMLGKVFENLLEVKDRKSKGAFYTPREIVHFMCQESIINYLLTNLRDKVDRDALESFIHLGSTYVQNEAIVFERGKETNTYKHILPESIRVNAKEIDELLGQISVCDPAVGSGAFPLGMLNEIVRAREVIAVYLKKKYSIYELKLHTISNSIYGVDIDSGAIEITKLRLWLALVVEEQDPLPLPNLDYKIMQGNSLISDYEGIRLFDDTFLEDANRLDVEKKYLQDHISTLQKEYFELHSKNQLNTSAAADLIRRVKTAQKALSKISNKPAEAEHVIDLFDSTPKARIAQEKANKLQDLIKRFVLESQRSEKERLKNSIDSLKWDLIETTLAEQSKLEKLEKIKKLRSKNIRPFFIWKLEFSDVFKNKGGFDVVIGNPPYVKEYTSKAAFEGLRDSTYYQGKMDLWYFFACSGVDLLKEGGIECFIAQNNWTTSSGAAKMRDKITQETEIVTLIDFASFKIFESADIQTMIMLFRKNKESMSFQIDLRRLLGSDLEFYDVESALRKSKNEKVEYLSPIIDRTAVVGKKLTFSNDILTVVLDKIKTKANFYLDPKTEVKQGIVCPQDSLNKKGKQVLGDDFEVGEGIFILSNKEKENLKFNSKELELIKPMFTTDELTKWYGDKKNKYWVVYTDSSFKDINQIKKFPNIKKHLDRFKDIITSDNGPYGLHRSRDEDYFRGVKIMAVRKCHEPTFTYTDFDCYVSQTFNIIKTSRLDLKYLLGLLNSKLIKFWLRNKGKMQGENYQIDKEPLVEIPIFYPDEQKQNSLIMTVDKLLKSKTKNSNDDIAKFEKEIDAIVFEFYDLTSEEIKVIEESFQENKE